MDDNCHILSTALPGEALIKEAADAGVVLHAQPFTQVTPIDNATLHAEVKTLAAQPATVVFTSAHAVRAVAGTLAGVVPGWDVYCLAQATRNEVVACLPGVQVLATANDAAALSEVIISQGRKEIVFFCGDQRMDTLPHALGNAGVQVTEMIVYTTTEVPHHMDGPYDGVLFYSPSGVRSYFAANQPAPGAVLFAIGNTTAAAIKERADNKVVLSTVASKASVLHTAITYFKEVATAP